MKYSDVKVGQVLKRVLPDATNLGNVTRIKIHSIRTDASETEFFQAEVLEATSHKTGTIVPIRVSINYFEPEIIDYEIF